MPKPRGILRRMAIWCLIVTGIVAVPVAAQRIADPAFVPADYSAPEARWTPDSRFAEADNPLRGRMEELADASSTLQRLRSIVSRMPKEQAPARPEDAFVPEDPAPSPRKLVQSGGKVRIPIATNRVDQVEIRESNGMISLSVRDVPLNRVLMLLGQQLGVNIVCSSNVTNAVSVTLERVPLDVAMSSLCSIAGCTWTNSGGVIHVTSVTSASKLPAEIQGRQLKVFRLDFAAATDVDLAVKGLLSPVGQSFISKAMSTDNRKTDDVVVVQDLPGYLQVIEQYVAQMDRAPRQVMIEAHVLAVTLSSDCNFGINFEALFHHDKGKLEVTGFADPNASHAFFFSYDGSNMDALLEALKTQKSAKTLASPKVLVLNGQEAKFQVGRQIGYMVSTTTETSTMQSVNFLDVGVVLKVTPRITRDGQVIMNVRPEVSDGNISEITKAPESNTTQVESSVILPDGRGMVIGGLIDEKDTEEQQKIPFLGDLWLVGRLFQHRKVNKERREVIITLLPRIVPDCLADSDRHAQEVQKAETQLYRGALERNCRPWDAKLPDAIENPAHLRDLCPGEKHQGCHKRGNEATGEPCVDQGAYYTGERRLGSCPPLAESYPETQPPGANPPPPPTPATDLDPAPYPPGRSDR